MGSSETWLSADDYNPQAIQQQYLGCRQGRSGIVAPGGVVLSVKEGPVRRESEIMLCTLNIQMYSVSVRAGLR